MVICCWKQDLLRAWSFVVGSKLLQEHGHLLLEARSSKSMVICCWKQALTRAWSFVVGSKLLQEHGPLLFHQGLSRVKTLPVLDNSLPQAGPPPNPDFSWMVSSCTESQPACNCKTVWCYKKMPISLNAGKKKRETSFHLDTRSCNCPPITRSRMSSNHHEHTTYSLHSQTMQTAPYFLSRPPPLPLPPPLPSPVHSQLQPSTLVWYYRAT